MAFTPRSLKYPSLIACVTPAKSPPWNVPLVSIPLMTLPSWSRPLLYEWSFDVLPFLKRSVRRKYTDALSHVKLSPEAEDEAETMLVSPTTAAPAVANEKETQDSIMQSTKTALKHLSNPFLFMCLISFQNF